MCVCVCVSAAPQFTALSGHTRAQYKQQQHFRVIFEQELRHPHIDKICVTLSRAFETCFPTSVSFYIEELLNIRTCSSQPVHKISPEASYWTLPLLGVYGGGVGGDVRNSYFVNKVSPALSMSDWIISFQTLTRVSLLRPSD
jgi:hypothetical protein